MFRFVSYPFSFSEFPFSYSFSALLDFLKILTSENSVEISSKSLNNVISRIQKNFAKFYDHFDEI